MEATDGGEVDYRVVEGGQYSTSNHCTKSRELVMEVLCSKHPNTPPPPTMTRLDSYPRQPLDLSPVDVTYDTVKKIVGRLSGGTGPGRTESVSLQHWLLQFSAESGEMNLNVADLK